MPSHTTRKSPNSFWPDGSQYQFDLAPRDAIHGWESTKTGGYYDIPNLPSNEWTSKFTGWSNWYDKFQKDYRFGNISDNNAAANIFPEVHDPWMFTEYVFKGTGKVNAKDGAAAKGASTVEPAYFAPKLTRNYVLDGSVATLSTDLNSINTQPASTVPYEVQPIYDLETLWKSQVAPFKQYWESELAPDNTLNNKFTRTTTQRRVVKYGVPAVNAGVRLYKQTVFSESARWGQSQNVPDRVVNLTAPKDYFTPTGFLTGRIVPHIEIVAGIPFYDVVAHPESGEQCAIRYTSYSEGFFNINAHISLFPVVPTGPDGDPDGVFPYDPAPATGFVGSYETSMPKNNRITLKFGPEKYAGNDLVHRGCQFWEGHQVGSGCQAKCSYYTQFSDQFAASQTNSFTYTGADDQVASFDVPLFQNQATRAVIDAQDPTDGTWHSLQECGVTFTTSGPTTGTVNKITLSRIIFPLKSRSQGGLLLSPGLSTIIRIRQMPVKTPNPVPSLCAKYQGANRDEAVSNYKQAGGKCPYYTPLGIRVTGSYTATAMNGAEWSNLERGLPDGYKKSAYETQAGKTLADFADAAGPIGMGLPAFMAYNYAANQPTPYPYTAGLPPEETQTYQVTFEPEFVSVAGKQLIYNTATGRPDSGESGESEIRIKSGTGQNTLDLKENAPYGGVDTVFFGMVNQINYRMLHNVMHCYRSDKCGKYIMSGTGAEGWRRGRYADIDFTGHSLKMPGYPALKSTEFCHYGDGRCPHTRLDRRAVEFTENYNVLMQEILHPFRAKGIAAFQKYGLQEAFLDGGTIRFLTQTDVTPAPGNLSPAYQNAMCVAVVMDSNLPPVIGHYQPVAHDSSGNAWRIFFFYDRPSWDTAHRLSRVLAHIIQFDDTNNPCYMQVPTEMNADLDTIYGNHATIPWLIELYDNYIRPTGNLVYATNNKPFAGGRNPEYRDMSKRGRELVCDIGGYADSSFMEGATFTNQFGGPLFNKAPIVGVGKMSYWIEKNGEWILDGRPIGLADPATPHQLPYEGLIDINPRIQNHPPVVGNNYPISGVPGIASSNPDTPDTDTKSDWAAVGHTYSNDTKDWIAYLRANWHDLLPHDPDSPDPEAKINVAPPDCNIDFLPPERYYYRCTVCGVEFPEEEVNYFLAPEAGKPPIYPTPSDAPAGTCGCPRGDGGYLEMQGSYDRFMKCYSRGEVDIWAPPGTTVKHDAYFWKNPPLVSRAHVDQIARKLGSFNKLGGGYTFADVDPAIDQAGRLPKADANGYWPGLNRQIIAPWAAAGQTVAQVRQTVKKDFFLHDSDKVFIQSLNQTSPTAITDETTVLVANDIVLFLRMYDDGVWAPIGVPVSASSAAPDTVLNESLVKADSVKPKPADYGSGPIAERLFQSELRRWLINCVDLSMQTWSSSMRMKPNALADQFQAKGKSPNLGFPFDPKTGATLGLDERFISAYAGKEGEGLRMVTLDDMKRLRNRILPMLAYDMGVEPYTANDEYTRTVQRSHTERFQISKKTMSFPQFGTVPPQVMAASQLGKDYYVEWDIGDMLGTKARAYYPVGTTWWRMNQVVGQIKRDGGQNQLHLDHNESPEYTGDIITSVCAFFIHGRIPMDKEVVRAYLIFTPDDPPSADAIGCQGQFTGYQGWRGFDGSDHFDGKVYTGHRFCFWQHYHGFNVDHEPDAGGYDHGDSYYDINSKNHVEWHQTPSKFTNKLHPNQPWLLGNPAPTISEEQMVMLEACPKIVIDSVPWIDGDSKSLYLDHVKILGTSYADDKYGFETSQPFLGAWNYGEDLKQLMTEHEIWKEMSYTDYDSLLDTYHVRGQANVNTTESPVTFDYFGNYFRNVIWPRQHQSIAGWINYGNYDSSGMFSKFINIEPKKFDDLWPDGPQVIFQAGGSSTSSVATTGGGNNLVIAGGGNGSQQAGSVGKILNITEAVKKIYNDRVARFYEVQLGKSVNELFTYVSSLTDTNLGLVRRFHEDAPGNGSYKPLYFWNYRYMNGAVGMWINDPWHMPELSNDLPVGVGEPGDPLPQSNADRGMRATASDDYVPAGATGHPYAATNLLGSYWDSNDATSVPFNASSPTSVKPAPAVTENKYWLAMNTLPRTDYVIMDLRQVPYENMRRPWRYQAPSIDASNAVCPNTSCWVHEKGWTVGQLFAHGTTTWGVNVIPNIHSQFCAVCHTKLTEADGLVQNPGDGVTTVSYDDAFNNDVLIDAFELSQDTSDFTRSAKHGFVVDYFNSLTRQWKELVSVSYDEITQKYTWLEWGTSSFVEQTATSFPTIFRGFEQANGVPVNPGQSQGFHFGIVTGSKIRYRVVKPIKLTRTNTGTCTCDGTNIVQVAGLTIDPGQLAGQSIQFMSGTTVLATQVIRSATTTSVELAVNVAGFTDYKIVVSHFVSKCSKFNVYGYPYRPGDITITPPGYVQPAYIGFGNTTFRLNNFPTQICTFTCVCGELEVPMAMATDSNPASGFRWEVVQDTYAGNQYLKIKSGKYLYDFQSNTVRIPSTFIDPTDSKEKSIWDLNQALYASPTSTFTLKTLPATLAVEYFTGNGVPLDVSVQATGTGPAWQLDRECVCFIANNSDDSEPLPTGVQSIVLPNMGNSLPLKNLNGQTAVLRWQVYNHDPLVWKQNISWLVGDELGAGQWNDADVLGLFSGGRGLNISNPGPGAALRGKVAGTCTLYGPPSRIISGKLAVYAKAVTNRKYNMPDGSIVQTHERTGGYRSGAFVFRLEVADQVSEKRTGITTGVPRVLIYLRERKLSDPLA